MTEPIDSFSGPYRFLSNFYIESDNTHVEGEYQSMKSIPPRKELLKITPAQSKAAGRRSRLRSDWELVKVRIMRDLVYRKFTDHSGLAEKLITTGDAELIEGNHWNDTFWGMCRGEGENWLGKILMDVRERLVAERLGIEL